MELTGFDLPGQVFKKVTGTQQRLVEYTGADRADILGVLRPIAHNADATEYGFLDKELFTAMSGSLAAEALFAPINE